MSHFKMSSLTECAYIVTSSSVSPENALCRKVQLTAVFWSYMYACLPCSIGTMDEGESIKGDKEEKKKHCIEVTVHTLAPSYSTSKLPVIHRVACSAGDIHIARLR